VYTVQYLERQRFEYHPKHGGTPYEILLGRLGAADAARRGLAGTAPFRPLPSGTTSDANCTFFRETGHRLCAGVRAYWQGHGLEFGDAGISYRESLALFGYPISEEFTDPATGLTVQYTERARFEYHPANPDPYKVLLARLGADLLAQRGW
jgi:spore germination protein